MADNSIEFRFSEEKYCTRPEVANALGTNLIEPFWNQIILYRKQFRKQIAVCDISKVPFTIAYVQSILNRIEELEEKISEYIVSFGGLQDGSVAKYTVFRDMCISELRYIAKINKINVNDVALNNIIEYKNVESLYSLLVRYFSAITHLDKNPTEKFDLRTIGRYYAIISGEDFEEFSFRKTEIQAASQRLLINREYEGAPVSEIPFLMNNLINYVNNSKDSFVTKVAVVTYLIKYIKPFEKYNEEMAAILSKLVVSISDVESAAAYIPLESIILDEGGKLAEVNREIQRSRDLTYQLTRVIDMFNDALDTVADRIVQVSAKELSNSATFGEDKKEFEAEFGFEPSREIIDEVKPVEQPKVEPHSGETQVVKKPIVHKPIEVIVRPQEEDDGPSDKQLRRMAQNLLEEDPLLKKGQAHFYVRHCTKGKYYTIQQYKKCEGCVYETARTSMDNLARLGYYRREQVKNKFVYTPIDKE